MSEKKLQSLESMFSLEKKSEVSPIEAPQKPIEEVGLDKLVSFSNHIFNLYTGKRFDDMVESIKEHGVIVPIVVRPKGDLYEILSGHNRVNAARATGLNTVPMVIREGLTDEEAELIVTETNLIQRSFSELLTSEKVAVIFNRYKILKNQGKRNDILSEIEELSKPHDSNMDLTSGQVDQKLDNREKAGSGYDLSPRMVARYVKLNELIKALLARVDTDEIAFSAALELSFLREHEQELIEEILSEAKHKIDTKKAGLLRDLSKRSKFTKESVSDILSGKSNPKKRNDSVATIKLKPKFISKYFKKEAKSDEIVEVIEKALKMYFEANINLEEANGSE